MGKWTNFTFCSRLRHKQSEWICICFSEAGGAGLAIGLDFERDVAPRIHFFVDLGVKPKQLGSMFTRNPGIFKTELHSLKTRVDYLKWKKFSNVQVRNDCIPRLKSHLILSAYQTLLTIPKTIWIVLTGTSDPFEVSRMVKQNCDGGRSPIGILSERFPSNGRPSSSGRR